MTGVVTKEELAKPVERLREQMEKLQLQSSHRSEGKSGHILKQLLAMSEESVRRLEREKQAAETRAEIIAERRVSDTEEDGGRKTNQRALKPVPTT